MTDPKKRNSFLLYYAGLASQLAMMLVLTIYGGRWLDRYYGFQKPFLIWLLPMLALTGMLVKLIRDTSKK